jgi:hypothetical protein
MAALQTDPRKQHIHKFKYSQIAAIVRTQEKRVGKETRRRRRRRTGVIAFFLLAEVDALASLFENYMSHTQLLYINNVCVLDSRGPAIKWCEYIPNNMHS